MILYSTAFRRRHSAAIPDSPVPSSASDPGSGVGSCREVRPIRRAPAYRFGEIGHRLPNRVIQLVSTRRRRAVAPYIDRSSSIVGPPATSNANP